MSGIVPLEQRKIGSNEIVVSKTKGMYYGVYEQTPSGGGGGQSSTGASYSHKREASSANSVKRKGKQAGSSFADTNGFSVHSALVKSTVTVDKKLKKQVIKEAEMEFKLRGKFKRVFPTVDYQYYKQFFTEERPLNLILDEKLMAKRRLGTQLQFF